MDRTIAVQLIQISNGEQVTAKRCQTGDGFDHASASSQVSEVAFGSGHRRLAARVSKDFGDRSRLLLIRIGSAQSMGVNVTDRAWVSLSQRASQNVGNRRLDVSLAS